MKFWKIENNFSLSNALFAFFVFAFFMSGIAHKYEWIGVQEYSFKWVLIQGWLAGFITGWEQKNES